MSSHGPQVRPLLEAASVRPLPDVHPAAALWWRIAGQLDHAHRTGERRTPDQWLPELTTRLGAHAEAMQASPWWVTLVDAVDRGLQRGYRDVIDLLEVHPVGRPSKRPSGPHPLGRPSGVLDSAEGRVVTQLLDMWVIF